MLPANFPWLSLMLFLPLLTGIAVLAAPRGSRTVQTGIAIGGSLLTLALGLLIYASFRGDNPAYAMSPSVYYLEEQRNWISAIGAQYHIGVDGLSVGLALLTAFLAPVVIWHVQHGLRENGRWLLFTILALETCLLGVLASVDVLLFYVFWEAMLIPMYFLISVWGGERRSAASLKFILYMMIGSLLMLAGILWVYWWHHATMGRLLPAGSQFTFNLPDWIRMNGILNSRIPHGIQMWMFFFFFSSFAIKVPLFPFHTWLPDAQVEAPIAFNVLLVEVGAYGFVRFCLPLFPDASVSWAPLIMSLAVINVIYGGILAAVQSDLKRLFAYSTISHAGFIMLGIFSMTVQGIEGGVLYMINSGLTTGALFLIGDILYRRRGSRLIHEFGGLASAMPLLFFTFMVVALGAIGLPGLNGFTSEFLVLLGGVRTSIVSPWYGYLAGAGMVLSAVYMLWMFQRVMYGRRVATLDGAADLDTREKVTLWPFVAAIFFIGIGSAALTRPMQGAVKTTIKSIRQGVAGMGDPVPGDDPQVTSASPGSGPSQELSLP